MLASLQSKDPEKVNTLCVEVWRYLAATWNLALKVKPIVAVNDDGKVFAYAETKENQLLLLRS